LNCRRGIQDSRPDPFSGWALADPFSGWALARRLPGAVENEYATQHEDVHYLSSIEFGNEITGGEGECSVSEYSVTMK